MQKRTTMKTKNMTLFAIAFTFALVMSGLNNRASAVIPIAPTVNVCAKQMCYDMRNCEGGQEERIQKPDAKTVLTRTAPNAAAPSKSAENVQGFVEPSCNQLAYWNYLNCIGNDKTPDADPKKDPTPNNSVVPTTNDK